MLVAAVERGWRVRCLCPPGPLARELETDGIRTIAIPELKLPAGPSPVAYLRLGMRVVAAGRALRRAAKGADAVVVNGIFGLPAVALARLAVPVVLLVHEVVTRPDRVRLLRLLQGQVTSTITVSAAAAAALSDAGIDAEVVPNGTQWPVAPSAGPAVSPRVVGCVGALTPGKGQHILLDAFSRLDRPEVVLELVGEALPKDHDYAAALRAQAESAGVADRIRFLGYLSEPLDRVRRWTAAVAPSVEAESQSLAVLEAMSVGVPVVATEHGGPPELLGQAGLLVPPGDAHALTGALESLLSDDALRRRCAAAGPARVAERYVLDDRVAELLDRIAAVPPPSGQQTAVIVVPDFDPMMGGTSRQARNQALGLMAQGRTVLVVTRRRERTWPAREDRQGVPVVRFLSPGAGGIGDKLSVVTLAGWLIWHRRQVESVQVVMYPDFVLSAAAAAMLTRTVLIWAGLGDATDVLAPAADPLRRIQRAVRRAVLNRCHHVVLTPAIGAELADVGLKGASLRVIPIPVDTERFHPPTPAERHQRRVDLGADGDDFVVIYTGHLRSLKGVDRLVEAFARLVATGQPARLLLVGGGNAPDECGDQLRVQVRQGDLDEVVDFVGVVSDVERYLWAADVFVLPSRREGLSNSLSEAMACGLACVAGPEAGGDQVLTDGAGVIPPSNEADDLFKVLSELAADPALRQRLGAAAIARAQEMSIEAVGASYDALLAGLERR
jgi:glycosyltransferase involved in cell wall biosynthesis